MKIKKNNNDMALPLASMRFEAITSFGTIQISEHVIMSVVKKAACAVTGVTKLAGKTTIMDTVVGLLYRSRSYDHSIKLKIYDQNVEVEVNINVAYNQNIPELALKVQNTITEEVKQITGMNVVKVNVIINEVEAPIKETVQEDSPDMM